MKCKRMSKTMQHNAEFTRLNAQLCHAFSIGEISPFRVLKILRENSGQMFARPLFDFISNAFMTFLDFFAYETRQWKIIRTFFAQMPVFFARQKEAYETT